MATMDWGDLHVFQLAGEELSFARAAGRLDSSRQMVSQRVARLERTLGVKLLIRTTARMELTEHGHRVMKWAQQTGDSWSQLQSSLTMPGRDDRMSMPENIVLGVSRIRFHQLHRRLLETWSQNHPTLKIFATPDEGLEAVAGGSIEGLIWERWPFMNSARECTDGLASLGVLRLPVYVFMAPTHPEAQHAEIELARLAHEPFISPRDPLIRHAKIRICQTIGGFTPKFVQVTDDQTETQELISAGLGLDLSTSPVRNGDGIARRNISGETTTEIVFSYSRRAMTIQLARIITDIAGRSFGDL